MEFPEGRLPIPNVVIALMAVCVMAVCLGIGLLVVSRVTLSPPKGVTVQPGTGLRQTPIENAPPFSRWQEISSGLLGSTGLRVVTFRDTLTSACFVYIRPQIDIDDRVFTVVALTAASQNVCSDLKDINKQNP